MAKKIAKILLGLALVPFCIGFLWQFVSLVFSVTYKPLAPYYFAGGSIAYLTAHVLFKKPILTYVFGHELTHAFFAMLFGGSVKSFQASDRGGKVMVSKSNFLITLAPYFFPLYTFIVFIFSLLARAASSSAGALNTLVFLSGATFTFHLMLTLIFLRTDQNDIREEGAVFSYPLIFLFNILFASFLLYFYLADNMDFLRFLGGGIIKSANLVISLSTAAHGFLSR
jgi:hypothetical protein